MDEIVLFKSTDGEVSLPVSTDGDTVWLSQAQMAELFGKDRTVIGRHIRNAIQEGEINPNIMCAKFAHMGKDADQVYKTDIYNLDVIISVGYRVHSQRGVEFRRWATRVLKDYLVRGAAINKKRLHQLGQAIEVDVPQGRLEAHRRSYARRSHGHDRRISSGREGDDGQSCDDIPKVNRQICRIFRKDNANENQGHGLGDSNERE